MRISIMGFIVHNMCLTKYLQQCLHCLWGGEKDVNMKCNIL